MILLAILLHSTNQKGDEMPTAQQVVISQPDPADFFAEICAAYVEVLAGLRRPEQLARWLSDTAYYDICQRYRREARARQVTGLRDRPDIVLRRTRTFLTSEHSYQGVVVLQISGVMRAVSIRAELIHERYRVTDIILI